MTSQWSLHGTGELFPWHPLLESKRKIRCRIGAAVLLNT